MATTVAVPPRSSALRVRVSKTAIRGAEVAVGTILVILILQTVLRFYLLDEDLWKLYLPSFLDGIVLSLRYLGIILPLSVLIGFTIGWARISRFRTLSWPLSVFVDFFRGVPPIIVVIFAAVLGPSLFPASFQRQDIGILITALSIPIYSLLLLNVMCRVSVITN